MWGLLVASSRNQIQTALSKKVNLLAHISEKSKRRLNVGYHWIHSKGITGTLSPFISWLSFHLGGIRSQANSLLRWPSADPEFHPSSLNPCLQEF